MGNFLNVSALNMYIVMGNKDGQCNTKESPEHFHSFDPGTKHGAGNAL